MYGTCRWVLDSPFSALDSTKFSNFYNYWNSRKFLEMSSGLMIIKIKCYKLVSLVLYKVLQVSIPGLWSTMNYSMMYMLTCCIHLYILRFWQNLLNKSQCTGGKHLNNHDNYNWELSFNQLIAIKTSNHWLDD